MYNILNELILLLKCPYSQPHSIKVLCSNVSKAAQNHHGLQTRADEVDRKFTILLSLFAKCHNGYNSSTYQDNNEIEELGMCNNEE